ncbi:MAG TPA: SHOCT domain-containing protein, partial [Spirochaetota bacterium]|nr:SHOCT domain-containing protein [Spirochaetota bacterium]
MKKMKNMLFTASIFFLTLPAALSAQWGHYSGGPGAGWCRWGGGTFFGGGLFMWILNLLLLLLVVFFAVKYFRGGSIPGVNKDTPDDILKKRLAKGEITKEEFDDLKKLM